MMIMMMMRMRNFGWTIWVPHRVVFFPQFHSWLRNWPFQNYDINYKLCISHYFNWVVITQNPGWLFYIEDSTTQLYGVYNKPSWARFRMKCHCLFVATGQLKFKHETPCQLPKSKTVGTEGVDFGANRELSLGFNQHIWVFLYQIQNGISKIGFFWGGLCHLFLTKIPEHQALYYFQERWHCWGCAPLPSLMNFRPPAIWQPCFAPAARWHSSKRSSRLRKSYKVGNVTSGNGENIWQLGVFFFKAMYRIHGYMV